MKKNHINLRNEYLNFIQSFKSLYLATVNEDKPEISYTPFVQGEGGCFYLYISSLARHTRCLLKNNQASVLFIEPESETKEIFARTRLTFDCQAEIIERGSEQWDDILNRFEARFGEIMQTLRSLNDFHLFKLKATGGNYVKGFAKAYQISGEDLDVVTHIRKA